ncbi:MAG: glycine cleavage system aminomethyltransferase GcvT [Gammaproteobacteria bacterium]|jgi:aminomethyltransferase
MDTTNLKKTALYALHIEQNATMVGFAGYEMPVQYSNGVKQEHLHTRENAGLFDISHMGQIKLSGNDAARTLEALIPSNIENLALNAQRYSVLTNEQGGILDDIMATNTGDALFVVINAACKEQDINYIQDHLIGDCQLDVLTDRALIAIQGPKAADVLKRFCPEATKLTFMSGNQFNINNIDCFISRCGYTGEDGFELSIPIEHVDSITRLLLAEEEVELIGLGARDSLRLEAGYCLYGHDLNENTSPVEANLNWVISKERLANESPDYPGKKTIQEQRINGTQRLRVGLLSDGKAPIREGESVLNEKEEGIGIVTSGGFSPSVKKPIAMAYIEKPYSETGTNLTVKVRNRIQHVQVVTLPFVKHNYYRA